MGTNFYRIPTHEEMESKKNRLLEDIAKMDISPSSIEREFQNEMEDSFDLTSPWDEFKNTTLIHLGKRSGGWKFCWNFHNNKYYKDKEELLHFIRTGRVVNEYGELVDNEEFITMALEWGQPDGWDTQAYYKEYPSIYIDEHHYDKYIDGLRVSPSTEFS
jgi:hypothetical protein